MTMVLHVALAASDYDCGLLSPRSPESRQAYPPRPRPSTSSVCRCPALCRGAIWKSRWDSILICRHAVPGMLRGGADSGLHYDARTEDPYGDRTLPALVFFAALTKSVSKVANASQ